MLFPSPSSIEAVAAVRAAVAARDAAQPALPALRPGDLLSLRLETLREGRWLARGADGLLLLLPLESGSAGQTLRLRVLSNGARLLLAPADRPAGAAADATAGRPAAVPEASDEGTAGPAMRLDQAALRRWHEGPPLPRSPQSLAQYWQQRLQAEASPPLPMEPARASVRGELAGLSPPLQLPGWGTQPVLLQIAQPSPPTLEASSEEPCDDGKGGDGGDGGDEAGHDEPGESGESGDSGESGERAPWQAEAGPRELLLCLELRLRADRVLAVLRWRQQAQDEGLHLQLCCPHDAVLQMLALRLPRLQAGLSAVPMRLLSCELLTQMPSLQPAGSAARGQWLDSPVAAGLLRAAAELARALAPAQERLA